MTHSETIPLTADTIVGWLQPKLNLKQVRLKAIADVICHTASNGRINGWGFDTLAWESSLLYGTVEIKLIL